jgi:cytoskeletal protein RodZ
VARYGSDDDQNYYSDDEPTRATNYGNYTEGTYDAYGQEPATTAYAAEPVPWYRKPVALVSFGAIGAVLIALVVYGLARAITGGDAPSAPNTTPLTPMTTTSAPAVTTSPTAATTSPTTTEPTTTATTTEPTTTTTTESTGTTTTTPSTSISTSTVTQTETQTQTVTATPPPPQP